MFEATVKRSGSCNFGFLENPVPGGEDIFIRFKNPNQPLHEGQKVLVLEERRTGKSPEAVKWKLVGKT